MEVYGYTFTNPFAKPVKPPPPIYSWEGIKQSPTMNKVAKVMCERLTNLLLQKALSKAEEFNFAWQVIKGELIYGEEVEEVALVLFSSFKESLE